MPPSNRRVAPPRNPSGRGPGGTWTGSSHWSPYDRHERVWPKILLVAVIVLVLIGGSVVVADRLGNLGVRDRIGGDDTGAVAGSPTSTRSQESPAAASFTPSINTPGVPGVPAAPAGSMAASPTIEGTATPVPIGEIQTAKDVAEAYAEVWSALSYGQLYDLLSSNAQAAISREDFVARYEGIAVEAGIITVEARITGGGDEDELYPMQVEIESSRVGTIQDENLLPVVKEGERYAIDWTPSLIFSQLAMASCAGRATCRSAGASSTARAGRWR
jgi:hypothetical protein